MEAVCFYFEDDTYIEPQRSLIDQWCSQAGILHLMVDRTGTLSKVNGNVFDSIQEVIDAHPAHTYIFLDDTAVRYFDVAVHPVSDVIYFVGSDRGGFLGFDNKSYPRYKIKTIAPDSSWYAASIVPYITVERSRLLK